MTRKKALNPDQFAEAYRKLVSEHSGDKLHQHLDTLVTDHLCRLGYSEGMEIFLKHAAPYHQKNISARLEKEAA